MRYALAADAVLVAHLAFIVFAAAGALLVAWRGRIAWLHLPALAWAAWIVASHGICPLTPLENALRQRAGEQGYAGGFIDHYLVPLIYPPGLTPQQQNGLALALVAANALLYGWAVMHRRRG
jgi:Protein of Unknown function (DUF2784)